ncbi:hypothetical protein COOONC_22298 [Cooperia oncophora]
MVMKLVPFNEAMLITLQPLQQETCITLKDHDNHSVGIISMKVNGIQFQCRKNIEFFTRDHHLTVHRCYSAGSCKEDACENTSATDKIKEFSFTANNSPGYTFCSQSCGCLTCDGCFFCQPSCLFYRIFAVPTTTTVYTIFTCPTWEVVVNMEVTVRQEDSTTSNTIQLHPGRTAIWNNLRFSLIGTIVHNYQYYLRHSQKRTIPPQLLSLFIEDSSHLTAPDNCNALQQHADLFNCSFSHNACKCTHGLHKASCVCSPGSVADLMQQSPLPQASKNYIIFSENKNIFAKINVGSALQIHFVAENMKVTSRQSNSTCTIEASDLIGCYSCIAGAELALYCQSSEGEVIASIECLSQTQIARCTPAGYISTLINSTSTLPQSLLNAKLLAQEKSRPLQ